MCIDVQCGFVVVSWFKDGPIAKKCKGGGPWRAFWGLQVSSGVTDKSKIGDMYRALSPEEKAEMQRLGEMASDARAAGEANPFGRNKTIARQLEGERLREEATTAMVEEQGWSPEEVAIVIAPEASSLVVQRALGLSRLVAVKVLCQFRSKVAQCKKERMRKELQDFEMGTTQVSVDQLEKFLERFPQMAKWRTSLIPMTTVGPDGGPEIVHFKVAPCSSMEKGKNCGAMNATGNGVGRKLHGLLTELYSRLHLIHSTASVPWRPPPIKSAKNKRKATCAELQFCQCSLGDNPHMGQLVTQCNGALKRFVSSCKARGKLVDGRLFVLFVGRRRTQLEEYLRLSELPVAVDELDAMPIFIWRHVGFVEGRGWDIMWHLLENRGPSLCLSDTLAAEACLHSIKRALCYRQGLAEGELDPKIRWDISVFEGVDDFAFVPAFVPEYAYVRPLQAGRLETIWDPFKKRPGGRRTHQYDFALSSDSESHHSCDHETIPSGGGSSGGDSSDHKSDGATDDAEADASSEQSHHSGGSSERSAGGCSHASSAFSLFAPSDIEADEIPIDLPKEDSDREGEGGEPVNLVFEYGTITYQPRGRKFVAFCRHHANCKISRTSNGHPTDPGHPGGRPLAYLFCWCKAGSDRTVYPNYFEHVFRCKVEKRDRDEARDIIEGRADFSALLGKERPRRVGEPLEPLLSP